MRFSRRLAGCLSVTLTLSLLGLPQALAAGGSLDGSIVRSADRTPMVGARLHIANPRSGEIFSSSPADPAGSFSVAEIPADRYALAVEHEGGLYVVQTPLQVSDGSKQTLNLAVTALADESQQTTQAEASPWNNPLTATLIALGIAVALGVALDEDNDGSGMSTSPSTPNN